MEIVPLGPGFAAELNGVTLAEVAADDAAYAAARAAFEEHSVLVFRGQEVTNDLAPCRAAGSARSDQGRLAGHGHPFCDPQHDRRGRQGRAGRSPACIARQGEPALAHG